MDEGDGMADAELILRCRDGEPGAFEALVHKHMGEAYRFCLRLTRDPQEAEDLSQQGFVSAYRALARFRGESSFKSWLYRIFINLHRDRLRRVRREEARLEIVREQARNVAPTDADEALRAEELSRAVRVKVAGLPRRQREVLGLHLYRGLSYPEIAAALGCSYDDVKMNLSLARRRLKEELGEFL